MGARGRTRHYAKAAQPNAARFTNTTSDRRASVRHPQSMDGRDALPDQDIAAREYRDELACACLQHETSDADPRNCPAHGGNQGIETLPSLTNTPEPRFYRYPRRCHRSHSPLRTAFSHSLDPLQTPTTDRFEAASSRRRSTMWINQLRLPATRPASLNRVVRPT